MISVSGGKKGAQTEATSLSQAADPEEGVEKNV